jgi:endothelin-converting enzyme/putative endopeptidase
MHTRYTTVLLALAACATAPQVQKTAASAASAAAPQRGVEAGDLDRSADPCGDFFQFANGNWRAANPIPQSMQRWSRRWQAGEANKDQLRSILEELSRREWPVGSVEQLVSDHYASCMDEA